MSQIIRRPAVYPSIIMMQRSRSINHQVKSFLEIKEDSVEGLQLEVRELLRHLCFDDRGASSVVCATAMKAVMQLDRLAVIVRRLDRGGVKGEGVECVGEMGMEKC